MADPSRTASVGDGLDGLKRVGLPASAHQRHVTVWLSSEAIAAWTASRSGRRGGQRRYSDLAIETALTLRLIYHLPLRQAEGFLHALFGIMRLDSPFPTIRRSPGAVSI